ncbi:MAG: thiamine pyrophosphate-dependent acetolactate synthase large subunit-like protein [Hyphomicrobiaceae bacterium]|jgi:thiamine pyrophosphate-dependent acetolactate synthase large subunit-like protein
MSDNKNRMDRNKAVPALLGNTDDFLIVAGLAGPAKDVGALTDKAFLFGGAMGGAVAAGLGLALAQPDKKVLCVTGDGDMLMSLGSLATVGVMKPANFSLVCVDNALYQETGGQTSHTGLGVDLAQVAEGCGFAVTRDVTEESQIEEASGLLRQSNGSTFILLRVNDTPSPKGIRNLHATETKTAFREMVLGHR